MGNSTDEEKSSKSGKSSSPAPPAQTNIHQAYPDWAAMQAYYGPRITMPPYYNSAMTPDHAPPPYMWGPTQPIMPPYGAPYATIYPHGGVYMHPAAPMFAPEIRGSHGHGVPSSPQAPTEEAPTKSSGNTKQGLMKKLKGFDGLEISIGNGTAENGEGGAERTAFQSVWTEGSNGDSDGNTTAVDQTRRKRSRERTPTIAGGEGNNDARSKAVTAREETAIISPKSVGTVLSPGMPTALELRNTVTMNAKSSPTSIPCVMPWLLNDREVKRERRKQSNRESARRSRLRKQAEIEELAIKVESLTAENATLRSEINQLTEKSEKLRLENATLVEGLENAELGYAQEIIMNKKEDKESKVYEKRSNSSAKLHQLLDPSPRADALAA